MKGRLLPGIGLLLVLVALMAGSSIAQRPELQTSESSQRMLSQAARSALASHTGSTEIVTVASREDNLREKRVLGHYMTWYKTPKTYGGPGCFNPEARGEWRM